MVARDRGTLGAVLGRGALLVPVAVVTAAAAPGCLPPSLAQDTEAISLNWELTIDDLGCTPERAGAADLPVVRIRSHFERAEADEDDELFDVMPCIRADGIATGETTPLPLGTYRLSLAVWDHFGGTVLGTSIEDRIVVLAVPGSVENVDMMIAPVTGVQDHGPTVGAAPGAPAQPSSWRITASR